MPKPRAKASPPRFARNHPGAVRAPNLLERIGRRLPPPRLLPVVMAVSVIAMGAKLGEVWHGLRDAQLPTIVLNQATAATGESAAKQQPPADAAPAAAAPAVPPAAAPTQVADTTPPPAAAPVSLGAGQNFKPDEASLLQALSVRRQELDARERDLDQRAALMQASQQQIDQKLSDLQKLRDELKAMTADMDKAREQQILGLVKIYETMKPPDAARIFEGLDKDVLLDVVARMKAAKTAPILAAMDPKLAKDLTIQLAERQALPQTAAAAAAASAR